MSCFAQVDRFIIQATTDEIALTGLKFFSVTRSFLLTVSLSPTTTPSRFWCGVVMTRLRLLQVAGTIATYEIVLVQFNGNKKIS